MIFTSIYQDLVERIAKKIKEFKGLMQAHFITDLKDFACVPYIKKGHWNGSDWITLTHIQVRMADRSILTIPAGFKTNFGSIPRPVRSFLNRMGKSLRAFVVHDWIYSSNCGLKLNQRECDEILYILGREDGESWIDAQAINKGLLLGGWACFDKSKVRVEPVAESVIRTIATDNHYRIQKYGL